jgi:4-amino-4-deoxy-L-arabinose transferase-like glycosyltransferase
MAGAREFAGDFFWTHHVVRFFAPFDHAQPFWFYVPGLLLGMLPWSLLLPPFFKFLGARSGLVARHRPGAMGFYLLAALTCLVFFSASGCKRSGYILPVFPPLALALGSYLATVVSWSSLAGVDPTPFREVARKLARLGYGTTLLALALSVGGSLFAIWTGLLKAERALAVTGLLGFGIVLVWREGRGRAAGTTWGWCAAATFVVLLAAVHLLLPAYARKFSLRGEVRRHGLLAQNRGVPVACYPHAWNSVSFYLSRKDLLVYTPEKRRQMLGDLQRQKKTLIFVKSGESLAELLKTLPPSLEFVPRGRQGTVVAAIIRTQTANSR